MSELNTQNWVKGPLLISWQGLSHRILGVFDALPSLLLQPNTQLQRTTTLGYAVFSCKGCHRTFNERTGAPYNFLEFPADIVFQVLRLCCKKITRREDP